MRPGLTVPAPPMNPPEAAAPRPRQFADLSWPVEVRHRSQIIYSLPAERVAAMVEPPLQLATQVINGQESALLCVESFFDQGDGNRGAAGRAGFEQTNYRLLAQLNGSPCGWLLGVSLGSLSAVAARYLWPAPWHLSAMEFQLAYDQLAWRYQNYRLRTQSQWANSFWEVQDTGAALESADIPGALSGSALTDHFVRRDGQAGSHRTVMHPAFTTRGQLKSGRCDLLERLGLLTAAELGRPLLVALQPRVTIQLQPDSAPFGLLPSH